MRLSEAPPSSQGTQEGKGCRLPCVPWGGQVERMGTGRDRVTQRWRNMSRGQRRQCTKSPIPLMPLASKSSMSPAPGFGAKCRSSFLAVADPAVSQKPVCSYVGTAATGHGLAMHPLGDGAAVLSLYVTVTIHRPIWGGFS